MSGPERWVMLSSRVMSKPSLRRRRIASLDVFEIPGTEQGPVVVLFHGFGADASDLASLSQVLKGAPGTTWIFPNGHQKVEIGPHTEGRAWFPISLAALEAAQSSGQNSGQTIDLSELQPPGLKKARELVFEMLKALNVPMSRITLGGFSQGAMLATEVTLRLKEKPAGLAILSGALVNATEWRKMALEMPGFKFYQSHGNRDLILKHDGALKLERLFKDAGWIGKLQTFNGGHEIPFEVISQLDNFLRKL